MLVTAVVFAVVMVVVIGATGFVAGVSFLGKVGMLLPGLR